MRLTNFYPRPPRGGRPTDKGFFQPQQEISIHALREEGDWMPTTDCRSRKKFLSTPSARRATLSAGEFPAALYNFYPRPPRGGRLYHSLKRDSQSDNFYPRPPRGGRPGWLSDRCKSTLTFLSTPSARRATLLLLMSITSIQNFYPRPPRGGRHEEIGKLLGGYIFLSTPSARRAT